MAAYPQPSKHPNPAHIVEKALKIQEEIDKLIAKMQKSSDFTPTRDQLENCGEKIMEFINKNHAHIASHEHFLKAAIIDLTEVPEMAPQMQRISFLTSLKDASKNLHAFTKAC